MYETSPAHGTGRMTRAWHARTVVRSRRASRVTRRRMVGRARAIVGWCAPMCATARAIARARRWARGGTSTGTVGGRTATREATTTAAAAKTTREREEGGLGGVPTRAEVEWRVVEAFAATFGYDDIDVAGERDGEG